ncbi:MAG: ferric reductase-like transmembrane domain-containing protein [Patescibacteria group bacterium]
MVRWVTTNKKIIEQIFLFLFIFLFGFTLLALYSIVAGHPSQFFFYQFSRAAGQAAVIAFVLSITPGIARRFGIRNSVTTILMLFRRQTGILVFLFGLMHYIIIFMAPNIRAGEVPSDPPTYQIMGVLALYALLPLFLTSNNRAVKKMGKWWQRLHRLVYVIAWLTFLHIALVEINFWAVLIGIFAVLETVSLLYGAIKGRR